MAIPTTGEISLYAIFKEVYSREPKEGEAISFRQCVQDSTLADKSFPCPFSRFRGYVHSKPVNRLTLSVIKNPTGDGYRIRVDSDYPVASPLNITVTYEQSVSGNTQTTTIYMSIGNSQVHSGILSSAPIITYGYANILSDSSYTYQVVGF